MKRQMSCCSSDRMEPVEQPESFRVPISWMTTRGATGTLRQPVKMQSNVVASFGRVLGR